MRLHRLRVWNFAAIRDIDIEFGPGLNVLYGPNDLGKSTLVDAIRLVLLLPHTSGYCEQFVPWTGSLNPTIELTFETEAQRIWRVKKEFGKSGSALLQESRDGTDFEDVARARGVDGRLRQLLRWGIAEPGGIGAGKGLPASFLCTALLSTQSNVSAMLRDSLEIDSAGSGKERIETALQAMAQDPMFMALFRYVQQCRDSAYTATGYKSASKNSPFRAAAERLNLARDEKERLHQIVVDSQGAEMTLRDLIGKRHVRQEALDVAQQELASLESLAAQASARVLAESGVKAAEDELHRIRKIDLDVHGAEQTLLDLSRRVTDAEQTFSDARSETDLAKRELAGAEEAVRAEGADPEIADTIVRQQLELRTLEIDKSAAASKQTLQVASEALRLVDAANAAEREFQGQCAAADRARDACSATGTQETALMDALGHCEILERMLEFEAAGKGVETAKAGVERERVLRERLEILKSERDGLVKQRSAFTLPGQAEFAAMRRLATDLAAARGALEVGLMITVTPTGSINLEVRTDGAASTTTTATHPLDIEARAEVEIAIPGVATFLVRGGRREAQQNMRTLEGRWNREAVPHLEAAGAGDVEELDGKIAEARDLDSRIKSREIEIESLAPQLQALAGASENLREASVRAEACRAAIGAEVVDSAKRDLKKLGADPSAVLRKKRQQLAAELEAARKTATDAGRSLTLAEERRRASKVALEHAVHVRDAAASGFPDDIPAVLQSAKTALDSANVEKEKIESEIASLENTIKVRKERVVSALAGAKKIVEAAEAKVRQAEDQLTKARTEHAAQAGRIEELRKVRAAEDIEAAEASLKLVKERLGLLPVPERIVTEAEVAAARSREKAAEQVLETVERDIQRAHGALAQVGGAVARERLNDVVEAFELAERQEKEVEEEYEAWKLLLDQMKEAEKAQASNLGQALAPAIAGRFQDLTAQRYENLQLTPELRTEGVIVRGTVRSTERISVGTREQLSTLYRLCLAEYLQTVLVLDDQLVQSDEMRMDWFRSLLKEKCRTFQIIVFTCRPRDYVEKTSLVPKGKAIYLDTDTGFTRSVDLGKVLRQQETG